MFQKACQINRNSIYGILCSTHKNNEIFISNGTAFAIAKDILVTTAHSLHVKNEINNQIHERIEIIRTPDIGIKPMNDALLMGLDDELDIAIIKVVNSSSDDFLELSRNQILRGTPIGTLGFPLSNLMFNESSKFMNLNERFQGSFLSGYELSEKDNDIINYYEIDSLMYGGSSGCPAFLENGSVIGMQSKTRIEIDPQTKHKTNIAISLLVTSLKIIEFYKKIVA